MKPLTLFLATVLAVTSRWVGAAESKPNIVLILGEAQGWASMSEPLDDLDLAGSKSDFIQTPNLDSLARAGIRFSDFHAASPRCTPTRAALVTGRSPAQLHMTFINEGGVQNVVNPGDRVIPPTAVTELPATIETMARMMKRAGYATAHFGKWHLGRVNLRDYGFDESDGPNGNEGPDRVESPNPKQAYAIAELGMDFMARQVRAGKPFFLQLSEYPCRGAVTALPETTESVKRRLGTRLDFQRISVAAGDEEVDKTIGLVLAKLKELEAWGKTYVIYTADHGAQGRRANGGLTQGKGTVWEGGLRVPLLVAGPGVKAGAFSHVPASTVDLLPTIASLSGIPAAALPPDLEGGSLSRVLKDGGNAPIKRNRDEFVAYFPHYDNGDLGPAAAIFLGNYKMIRAFETGQCQLFDLSRDIEERNNLASTNPGVAATMDRRLSDYLAVVKADLPRSNPHYDPAGKRSGNRRP